VLNILKSLTIVLIISTLVTAVCHTFFTANLVGVFVLTTILQISLSWFITTYIDARERRLVIEHQGNLLTQIESEVVEAPCAYCGEVNLIPVSPTQDNDFECLLCNEHNAVYVNITVAQKSVPFDSQPYEVTNYSANLQNAKSKALSSQPADAEG
jgi:hypothetical protein